MSDRDTAEELLVLSVEDVPESEPPGPPAGIVFLDKILVSEIVMVLVLPVKVRPPIAPCPPSGPFCPPESVCPPLGGVPCALPEAVPCPSPGGVPPFPLPWAPLCPPPMVPSANVIVEPFTAVTFPYNVSPVEDDVDAAELWLEQAVTMPAQTATANNRRAGLNSLHLNIWISLPFAQSSVCDCPQYCRTR